MHRCILLTVVILFIHLSESSQDVAVSGGAEKTERFSFLNLRASFGPTPTADDTKTKEKRVLPFSALRVRAVNKEGHVTNTKKDEQPQEIIIEKIASPTVQDETATTVGYRTYLLNPPGFVYPSEKDDENQEEEEEVPSKEDERIIALFDDRGRVGPNYEVLAERVFVEPTPIPTRIIQHQSIDSELLEREIMVVNVSEYDREKLRSRLANVSLLEDKSIDRHRDLGSSFILPVLSRVEYDNNSVPLTFSDIPVNVAVQFNVLYLASFDSELMEYSIDLEMELTWYDLRLANNYTKPIRIREKQILDLIWRPDPYIINSKYSYFHHVSFPNFRMRITPEGLVTYTMRVTSVCNCFMMFCLYPHDHQTCDMKISSIAYPSSFVRFHWHNEPIRFQSHIALPELHVQEIITEECTVEGKLLQSSCLRLVFELERDGGRFLVEKYIPSTLAMMFAWVAPYVPYNYEDVRIITPITVLLTLVQMEKGDREIRTSYLTSLDVWFAAMKMFTVLSLVESLTVLSLIKRSRAMEKNASKAPNEFDRLNFHLEARRLNRFYHRLDSASRFLSPLVFVLFFVYYVLFVAQGDGSSCVQKREMMRR